MKDTSVRKNEHHRDRDIFSIFKNKRHIIGILIFSLILSLSIQQRFNLNSIVGGLFISTILLFLFYRDLLRYKPEYIIKDYPLLAIGTLFISTNLIARLSDYLLMAMVRGLGIAYTETHLFMIPIASGAMLATLLFDFHTAIVFSFMVSILSVVYLSEPLYSIYYLVGSLVGAFSVINSRKRSAILRAGMILSITNTITGIAFLIFKGLLLSPVSLMVIFSTMLSGFISTVVVFLLLPVFEYIFDITTDISLMELLDVDNPLMKSLMVNAPGTYHHSVIVGNLVESAAGSVGVSPLLAKVGAYYHDIGKIKMPNYFIENQAHQTSMHEEISPHLSSLVLLSHIREGVELSRQYRLPEVIRDIIAEHHGDSLMTYFYEKAKEVEDDVKESDYRYHGPRPRTKVSALIMMADAVEAASRVLTEPTPQKISGLVDRVIDRIIIDKQLDECDLTFKDISEIKKRFVFVLTGILHRRINYPGLDFNEDTDKNVIKKEENKTFHYNI